ncbi:MAG TPA: YdcF family protein [Bacteroidia bacterium]|nr:YdcF family protein [Bacteroidia bacterium]
MLKILKYTLIFIAGIFLISCLWFVPSVKKLTARSLKDTTTYDAIIVPGVPFNPPSWDMVMKMRLIWAVHLYKRGHTKNIIMSGSSVYSPYVEAEIMRLYAIKMGVPANHIFVEGRAEHSTENIWYGYKLAQKNGFKKVALASDPFQSHLLYSFARRRIKGLQFLPVIFDTLETLSHNEPKINYDSLRVQNFIALPDREGHWQRFRGTMGKHIHFKE